MSTDAEPSRSAQPHATPPLLKTQFTSATTSMMLSDPSAFRSPAAPGHGSSEGAAVGATVEGDAEGDALGDALGEGGVQGSTRYLEKEREESGGGGEKERKEVRGGEEEVLGFGSFAEGTRPLVPS